MFVEAVDADPTRTGALKSVAFRVLGPRGFATARSLVRLARDDWHAPYPLTHRLKAWRHGFFADTYLLYDIEHNNAADYINDFTWAYRCSRLNDSLTYFRHKLAFRSILLHAGLKQAETLALVAQGRFLLNPLSSNPCYVSANEFEELLRSDGGRFVVKPEAGNRGAGIFLLDAANGNLVRQRGAARELFRISDLPSVAIVERLIQQGPFWRALCPHTTNSLRVVTGWVPDDEQPTFIGAVQRIGTADTVPTDNWSGGGISAVVDLDRGRLGPGRVHPLNSKYPNRHYDVHPDSKAQIQGAVLPHWDYVRETVIRACMTSPMHHYVGWDVVVDENGDCVIIEANGNSGLESLQVHGGLLANPAARRFYERCGAI